jgi:hypothetical protein
VKVQYQATQDDILDTHLRLQKRSKLISRWMLQGMLFTGLIVAVLFALLISGNAILKMRWAIAGFFMACAFYYVAYRGLIKGRMRKFLREQMGTDGPVPFEVELTPDGIWTKLHKVQLSFAWEDVSEISDLPDSIEMYVAEGGIVVVRDKAFSSTADRKRFLEIARSYQQQAQPVT